ncbi:glutaredoxin 2 [Stenoxybacter acetivorans]|uniref:glutaredoxin 2 n=1 Tax=Stenoxybacter acetivorans TaxID=422441 RepID=UPI00056B074F|nr:glutaredoxin 2 [Stenoxybacter acetivorans]
MKLYTYDHCPYCTRARMIFGWHNIDFEHIILLNDDESTPVGLIGKKMVPILVKADGTAMGESLDIVRFVDNATATQQAGSRLPENVRPEIEAWLAEINEYQNRLIMPRCVQLNLAEFATQSAIAYFVNKKTAYIGDFSENLKNSAQYLAKINADLIDLADLIHSPEATNGVFSMEDILLFPILRNLSMVKGVDWQKPVLTYLENMSAQTKIDLFSDRAI